MAKIKWKNQTDIDTEKAESKVEAEQREKFKGKAFGTLSTKEKDELLEMLARAQGLID